MLGQLKTQIELINFDFQLQPNPFDCVVTAVITRINFSRFVTFNGKITKFRNRLIWVNVKGSLFCSDYTWEKFTFILHSLM